MCSLLQPETMEGVTQAVTGVHVSAQYVQESSMGLKRVAGQVRREEPWAPKQGG